MPSRPSRKPPHRSSALRLDRSPTKLQQKSRYCPSSRQYLLFCCRSKLIFDGGPAKPAPDENAAASLLSAIKISSQSRRDISTVYFGRIMSFCKHGALPPVISVSYDRTVCGTPSGGRQHLVFSISFQDVNCPHCRGADGIFCNADQALL